MTKYEELKQTIRDTGKKPDNFNLLLIDCTEDILIDIALRNQHRVAKDLDISSVKLSNILPLLKDLRSQADD